MYADSGFQPPTSDNSVPLTASTTGMSEENEGVDPSFLSIFDDEDEENGDVSPDLYAVLSVARDASETEIRAAYRRLSRLLHPDKHPSEGLSVERHTDAEAAFGRITAAYNVLIDAHQRAVYDQYGFRGLRVQGWELAVRDKSAPELRLEYLLLKQKAREEEQSRVLQPDSDFSIGIDATDLFDRYLQEPTEERNYLPSISIYEVAVSQSIIALRTLRNTVSLAGQVTTHNGLGVGTLLAIWQRQFSPSTPYLGAAVTDTMISYGRGGRGLGIEVKLQKQALDRVNLFTSTGLETVRNTGDILIFLPYTSFGCQFQISPQIRSTIQYKFKVDGGIFSDSLWVSEDAERSFRLQCRLSNRGEASLSTRLDTAVDWTWMNPFRVTSTHSKQHSNNGEWYTTLDEDEVDFMPQVQHKKGRVSLSFGCNPYDFIEARFGVNCVLSEISRLSGEMGISWLRGITLRLSLHRGGQTYALPIKLSENLDPVAFGYGVLVPFVIYGVVRNLVYAPWALTQIQKLQNARRQRLRDELRQLRSEALATQALMQHTASRNAATEKASNGLVIVRGIYGNLSNETPAIPLLPDLSGPVSINVTIPLQASVENHQLFLPPGRWANLQGFYDPCAGLAHTSQPLRQLFVAYEFNGLPHEVCVDEHHGLAVPMNKHRVANFSQ